MSAGRLAHLANLLEAGGDLPPASREFLRDSLRRWQAGATLGVAFQLAARDARRERDAIIRSHAAELPSWSSSGRARELAEQARRLHSGRQANYWWIAQADRLHRLPETPRQYHHILK